MRNGADILVEDHDQGLGDYKVRRAVDCAINCLKGNHAVATRFDKLAVRFEATIANRRHRRTAVN